MPFVYLPDDEDQLREELKDLIDDNEESEGEDSDGSDRPKKRKKSDDEDFDDRLEDEDYDLIEENLGVKFERVCLTEWGYWIIFRGKKYPMIVVYKNFTSCFRNVSSVCEEFKTKSLRKSKKRRQMKKEML